MKTTIVIEDGRVTVQVDDQQPISVKTSPPAKQGPKVPDGPVYTPPAEISPPDNRTCEECGGPMNGRPPIAKICGKPECKKARVKKQNEAARRKAGQNVGVGRGRGRRPIVAGHDQYGHEPEKHQPLHEDAPPAKTYTRSKCCEAKVEVAGGEDEPYEGGTRHYVCLACMNACDTYEYTPPFEDPWNCGACRTNGRLCRMHASMEADGKKAPQYVHQL